MPTYYIVQYFRKDQRPKIRAFTNSVEKAQELCSQPETRKENAWFWGYTEYPPIRPSKKGYPSAGDLLREIYDARKTGRKQPIFH